LKKLKNKLNLYFFFVNLKLKKKLNNKAYFLKNLNKKLRLSNKFLKVLKTDKEIIKFLKNLTIDYIEKLKYDVICFSLLKNIFFKLKDKRFKHFFLSFTFDSINKIYDIKKLKINYYKKINNNLKNFSKKNVKFDIDFIFIFILFKYYYLKSKYLKKKKINRLRKNL